jgi:ABC-type branched-subunit amino acid transport system substrate-binding protein
MEAAATTYEKWINANGGIGGRPLEVLICDEKGDPAAASDCARQAIQEEVVAVIGSFGYTGDATIPLLDEADIAYFGTCCTNSSADMGYANSLPIGNGPTYGAALAQRAVDDGRTKVTAVLVDGTQIYEEPIANAMISNGLELQRTVIIPATAQDLSPQVAEATSGDTDAIIIVAGEDSIRAFMTSFVQTGSDARIYGPQGNLTAAVASEFPEALEGAVTGNTYSDISAPVWDDFRAALKEYAAPDIEYNGLDGLGTWAAYTAFTSIVEGMTDEINSANFLKAAQATSDVNTDGMAAAIDFRNEWTDGLPGYERQFNRSATFSEVSGGKLIAVNGPFADYTPQMLGQPVG